MLTCIGSRKCKTCWVASYYNIYDYTTVPSGKIPATNDAPVTPTFLTLYRTLMPLKIQRRVKGLSNNMCYLISESLLLRSSWDRLAKEVWRVCAFTCMHAGLPAYPYPRVDQTIDKQGHISTFINDQTRVLNCIVQRSGRVMMCY